jgi:phage baseplate assembly protein W
VTVSDRTKSLRFPLKVDESLGRLELEGDYVKYVEQLMRQVLLTNPGERVHRPDFGCGIRQMVFSPNSEVAATLTQVLVSRALQKWMGDVIEVDKIQVEAAEESLIVRIAYRITPQTVQRYLNVEVSV